MSKKALMNNVYKNYIFDFYGTLVDILTDEKDPALIELKGVAYPEVDLAHIFNQLYVDGRPQSSCLHQLEDWGQLIAIVFRVLSRVSAC